MTRKQTFVAAAATVLLSLSSQVSAVPVNVSCDAYADNDSMLWARHVDTGDRVTFDVTVKLAADGAGLENRSWPVFVGTARVGNIGLTITPAGLARGGLSLDSGVGYVDSLPPNWPGASAGTLVRVGDLACQLRG